MRNNVHIVTIIALLGHIVYRKSLLILCCNSVERSERGGNYVTRFEKHSRPIQHKKLMDLSVATFLTPVIHSAQISPRWSVEILILLIKLYIISVVTNNVRNKLYRKFVHNHNPIVIDSVSIELLVWQTTLVKSTNIQLHFIPL